MRTNRSRIAIALMGSALLSIALTGGIAAQSPEATDHALVGTWIVATGDDAASDASDLYVVHADGTVTDVPIDGPVGVGSWLADGDRGATITLLSPLSDDEGGFAGHRVARGTVDVSEDGASLTGAFSVELTSGADGTTGQLGHIDIVGQRVVAEAPAEAVPTTATPLTPAPRSTTDCAGQPVLLTQGRSEFRLTGDCPDVRVEGTDIDVFAQDVGTLLVVGNENEVRANAVSSATLQGRDNDLSARSVGALVILGNSNEAIVLGPIDSVVIDGSRNEVVGRPIGSVVSNGRFNDIGRR